MAARPVPTMLNLTTLEHALQEDGRALLKCAPGTLVARAEALAGVLGPVVKSHERAQENGVVHLRYNPRPPGEYQPVGEGCAYLPPHTDSPFRDPSPRVIAMGCIAQAGTGGETILVDGKGLLQRLAREHAGAIDRLSRTSIHITRDQAGRSFRVLTPTAHARTEIRYRNDAGVTLEVPSGLEHACRAIGEYVNDPANREVVTLAANDLLVLDNTRFLHGRLPFEPASGRHLVRVWYAGAGLRLGVP